MIISFFHGYFFSIGLVGFIVLLFFIVNATIKTVKERKFFALISLLSIGVLLSFSVVHQYLLWIASAILIINVTGNLILSIISFTKHKEYSEQLLEFPTISIVIPAKNEAAVIKDTLRSMHAIDYPKDKYEIIVIDDGSTDNTNQICQEQANILTNLRIIRNEVSKGKSRALNSLIQSVTSDYFMIFDADHHVDPQILKKVLATFDSPKVACVQTKNLIRNGKDNLLASLVDIEYLHRYEILYRGKRQAFFLGSGGIFKTNVLKEVGGFTEKMLTEDLEISFKLYELGYEIKLAYDTASYELACKDFKNYYKQRHRWFRGIWQSVNEHFMNIMKSDTHFRLKLSLITTITDNLSLISCLYAYCMFALGYLGLYRFEFNWLIYVTTIVSTLSLYTIFLRTNKYFLLRHMYAIGHYYILFAYPNLMAMLDNWLLKTEYAWIKTDRK